MSCIPGLFALYSDLVLVFCQKCYWSTRACLYRDILDMIDTCSKPPIKSLLSVPLFIDSMFK